MNNVPAPLRNSRMVSSAIHSKPAGYAVYTYQRRNSPDNVRANLLQLCKVMFIGNSTLCSTRLTEEPVSPLLTLNSLLSVVRYRGWHNNLLYSCRIHPVNARRRFRKKRIFRGENRALQTSRTYKIKISKAWRTLARQ